MSKMEKALIFIVSIRVAIIVTRLLPEKVAGVDFG